MLKPDTVQRNLIGEIIGRFERRGLKFVALKLLRLSDEKAEELYNPHKGKEFFGPLVEYVTSGPVLVGVIEGEFCIQLIRKMMGATDPKQADAGSIRGDFGIELRRNVIHASDSEETAKREIGLFFEAGDMVKYEKSDAEWVYQDYKPKN